MFCRLAALFGSLVLIAEVMESGGHNWTALGALWLGLGAYSRAVECEETK